MFCFKIYILLLLLTLLRGNAEGRVYGTSRNSGLVRIDTVTGRTVIEVPDLPEELQAQELSTIDKSRQRYYIIGYNDTTDKTNLVGWDLKKKEVFVDTTLPLSESEFVGLGQALDADPVSGDLFVLGRAGGEPANSSTHSLWRLHFNTTFSTKEHIAHIDGIDILDGSSAYDSKRGIEYVAMIASGSPPNITFNIFAVNVKTHEVTKIKEDAMHGKIITNLDYDRETGRLYGMGSDLKASSRAIMYLEPKADKFVIVGDIPSKYLIEVGNVVTLDEMERVYYALLSEGSKPNITHWKESTRCHHCNTPDHCCYDPAEGQSTFTCFAVTNCSQITNGGGAPDLKAPIHLFGMHLDTGKVVSKTPPVCTIVKNPNSTLPICPWTIEASQ